MIENALLLGYAAFALVFLLGAIGVYLLPWYYFT